jgi:hypothetical protein
MITGYGVAEAVRHYYETYGGDVKGRNHCARFWNVSALKVIGIIDRDGGLINENGFTLKK